MILKDPKRIVIVKKQETAKHYWGEDHNFSWNQNKFLIGKAGRLMKLSIL